MDAEERVFRCVSKIRERLGANKRHRSLKGEDLI